MMFRSTLLLLVFMIVVGILYGITFHSVIMPFFGGQLIHCTLMGLIFGIINFSVAYFFYRKINSLKDDNINLNQNLRADTLTGLLNRRAFDNDIQFLSDNLLFSVIFLDIDNFRDFNNKYGHPVGDLILKKVSYVIKLALKEKDLAYRYGGEEIVIILPEQEKENALMLSEEIRTNIARLDNSPYSTVSVSIGVSSYPQDGLYVQDVVKAGDFALLKAKSQGKNRTIAFNNNLSA